MINLTEVFETKDRWPLKVTKIDSNESLAFDRTNGTYYILLKNADFFSDSVKFEKVNATFCVNHHFTIKCCHNSSAVVIEYLGLHLLESRYFVQDNLDLGNLSYIDGGTNTTAVNPGRLGDPVVNYVHFPAHMYQTLHTHPSHRIGLVLKGKGQIELNDNEYYHLSEGEAFFMRRNELHNFMTNEEDVILFVFAPDSGTGPTDDINPLKVRTYIGQQRNAR
jgi:quercetin dioxygenase-like cupin family protein